MWTTLRELNDLRRYFGTFDFLRLRAWRYHRAWMIRPH